MNETAKKIYQNILRVLPTKPALYIMYFRGYHKLLNLKKPKYYGEKIQWTKLHGQLEELGPYVDKYEVRKYVERTIGSDHLFKVYGVYDNVEDIDFFSLPDQFVIKCTNGSQAVIICKDKNSLNIGETKRKIQKWLNDDFYKIKKEFQYKNVKNRILIEEYVEDDSGELRDYKFYCFDGKPYWYSVFTGRFSDKTVDTYTIDGKFIPDFKNGSAHVKTSKQPIEKFEQLNTFIDYACKLSSPFSFVRVDFYLVNGVIYFGELTFTDGAGCEPMFPIEKYDVQFGAKIPLMQILKNDRIREEL